MKSETIIITCDECQAVDADEYRYAVMGREYALDLCSACRAIVDNLMAPYIQHSRNVTYRNHAVRRDGKKRTPAAPPVFTAVPVDSVPQKPRRGRPRKVQADAQ
jgi:hypothetical protein